MNKKLYIDVVTGEFSRELSGPKFNSLTLYLRDLLTLDIAYVQAGNIVTSTVLADSAVQRVAIKSTAVDGAALLAGASTYTIASDFARTDLSLNTTELTAFFTNNVPGREASFLFEVEVESADESERDTLLQCPVLIRRDVNQPGDIDPTAAEDETYVLKGALFDANGRAISREVVAHRWEITARTGGTAECLDAIATTALAKPFLIAVVISGTAELWQLAAGTDSESVPFIVRPDDYDGSTNAVVWKRVL